MEYSKLMTYMKKIIQHNYSTEFKISLFSLLSRISASHENFNKTFIPILILRINIHCYIILKH